MSRRRNHAAATALLTLAACTSSHGREQDGELSGDRSAASSEAGAEAVTGPVDGSEAGRAGSAGGARANNSDGGEGEARAIGVGDPAAETAGAAALDAGVQVWLGELRSDYEVVCEDRDAPPSNALRDTRMLLLLELDASGEVEAASVTLGEGEPPPPAEDPDLLYPPDAPWWPSCPLERPLPGVEYPGYRARLRDSRLELSFYAKDVFGSWCALQQSYPASAEAQRYFAQEYLCRPTEGMEVTYTGFGADLEVEQLCLGDFSRACRCDATRCQPEHDAPYALDLLVEGDEMQGRLIPGTRGTTEVRLRRER